MKTSEEDAMKKGCLVAVLVCLCLAFATTAQAEVQHIGKMCLTLAGPSASEPMQVDILYYGTDIFPLHGKLSGNSLVPVHGTAVIDGTKLNMTLTASNVDAGMALYSATYSITVNLTTLTGTFFTLRTGAPAASFPAPNAPSYVTVIYNGTASFEFCL
jgi:hypothetical protein